MEIDRERLILNKISASRRLDFRWLDDSEITDIKRVLEGLYFEEKLSTTEIARKLHKSQYCVWNICRRLGTSLRTPDEGGRIYAPKRAPNHRRLFDGTILEQAYLKAFARGDLDVRRVSSLAILVSATTTHPDFVSLFASLFRTYGPVYTYPVYDKARGYRWKVAARLDLSFSFMLEQKGSPCTSFSSKKEFFAWLAGIIDSDGSVGIIHSGNYARLNLQISNQDVSLLDYVRIELGREGFFVTGPYRNYIKGQKTRTWHIRYNADMFYLLLQRGEDVRRLLPMMPLRHSEEKKRRELALRLPIPALWKIVGEQVEDLKREIAEGVADSVSRAEDAYKVTRHKKRWESATLRLSPA